MFYADERLGPGPVFGSANVLKGAGFTDAVGVPLRSAKPSFDWNVIGSFGSNGEFSLRA